MKFAILKNEFDEGYVNWVSACYKYKVDCEIIDLISDKWLETVMDNSYNGFLACPPGREELFKKLYDERVFIINKVLNKLVYPSFDEISVHENKKYLSYWLHANNLPHPKTFVFYDQNEALYFAKSAKLPIVGKMNIGASGKGVVVFRDRNKLIEYISRSFKDGLRQEWGPNLKMGGYKNRIIKILNDPGRIIKKIKIYQKNYNAIQKGFVILQEFIDHDYEWRVVRIGDSYFGHQKVKQGDKASGTKGIDYIAPPEELLDFVENICAKFNFNSMAIDLFEDGKGGYLINEMQCIFGHVQAFICEKDGKPGRFKKENGTWQFEEGMFNNNLSYDLRLENVLSLIAKQQ
ncbi:MAG: hypothetical protein JW925_10830 [Syntrophaceae bacterium]|nr:hypothetical protein [Syntrophaceae bacterium]